MHILLTNVHLDCRGEGSSNSNASRDESVETGDESVETGDESIEAGEKTPQSCYNTCHWIGNQYTKGNTVECLQTICFDNSKNSIDEICCNK